MRWLLVALALAFPAATLSVAATGWNLADQAIAAANPTTPATHPKTKAKAPSRAARADIPPAYLAHYRTTGGGERWGRYQAWAVLAGVGKVESDHGRSRAPGVRSGVNRFGCCAGPMQFNLRNGPPSTWDTYGHGSPYDPAQAIPAARRLLAANGARRDLDRAIYSYNHSWAYVAQVKAQARRYQEGT